LSSNTFSEGQHIERILWLVSGTVKTTKTGDPYWEGQFSSKDANFSAKLWNSFQGKKGRVDQYKDILKPNNPVKVKALIKFYNNEPQLQILDVEEVMKESINPTDFAPAGTVDANLMLQEFDAIVSEIPDEDYKKLLLAFRASGLFNEYQKAPAAKSIHHAWLGGLLEHSLGLAKAVRAFMPLYPALDGSLLVAGAFLHDVGKTMEISQDPGFEYTVEGRLFGHIYMGAKFVEELIEKIGNFPISKKKQIIHLILSHQGERAEGFGSPVDPSTVEAVFFHHLDNLDAKVRHGLTTLESAEDGEGFIQSGFPMKMSLYYDKKPNDEAEAPSENKPKNKGSLFEE
jgi:3'-5' exoribonuclease